MCKVRAGQGHGLFYWGLCALQLKAFLKHISQVPMVAHHLPASPGISPSQVSWDISLDSHGQALTPPIPFQLDFFLQPVTLKT